MVLMEEGVCVGEIKLIELLAPVGELFIRLTGVEIVNGGGGGVRVAAVSLGG